MSGPERDGNLLAQISPARAPGRTSPLGGLFPWPLVGIALLLVIGIVVTPTLVAANGQPPPGVSTYAQLIVDALPGNNSTHYYVRSLGTTTRYAEIQLGFAFGFPWTGAYPTGRLNWTDWQNVSDVLSIDQVANGTPVAVNVTAYYTANGASALYVGVFAIYVGIPAGSSTDTLFVASDTPGIGGFSYPVSDLPLPITLLSVAAGGRT